MRLCTPCRRILARSIGGPGSCLRWATGLLVRNDRRPAQGTTKSDRLVGSVRRRIAARYTLKHTRMHPQTAQHVLTSDLLA